MNRTDLAPAPALAWGEVAAGLLLALGALALDGPGRLLAVPAGVLLIGLGLRDALLRPVLSIREDGLSVLVGPARRQVPWDGLVRARVVTDRRSPLLELDLDGGALVVLSRHRLGCPPWQALELLEERREVSR